MTRANILPPNPKLDLVLTRVVDVPRELVWRAWTVREHLLPWFVPKPWTGVDAEIDLRPGGIFRFVMRSPEGKDFSNVGCYLEVVENERLVWTSVLGPGYRPNPPTPVNAADGINFTAVISLEPSGKGTKYTAMAIHGDEETARKHEKMGFHDGWGKALDQLVELLKKR